VLKLCYKPRELYSSVNPSFGILCFGPGHVASAALGTTLPSRGAKLSKEDKSFQVLMGNEFMWSSLSLASPENLQRRLQVLAPTSQHLSGR